MGDATKSVIQRTAGLTKGLAQTNPLLMATTPLGLIPGAVAGVARDVEVTRERGEFAAKDSATKAMEAEADAANKERISKYYAEFEKEKGAQRLGRNSTMSRGILLNDNKGGLLR